MIIKRGRYVRFIYKAFEYVYECILVPFSLNTDIRYSQMQIEYSQFVWYNGTSVNTPVVRNGKQSTLGYQPDVWKGWN